MDKFSSASEVIETIEKLKNNHKGLDNFAMAMEKLGNIESKLKTIHVAGTNGKGSTVNYLRSILQTAGYRVATFTSPYLVVHNDRIRINDVNISDADLLKYANQTYDLWETYDLSMFEIDMMIACLYFYEQKVDYAIFEVGLGGRIDATNIIDPMISVITNIGLDHVELLGHTHALIALEKAGIIKTGKDCVTAETREDCLQVFEKTCEQKQCQLHQIAAILNQHLEDNVVFDYRTFTHLKLSSKALYQARNAALAIETVLLLRAKGLVELTDQQIAEAVTLANWAGRFETVWEKPLILIDGAHNEHGMKALVETMHHFDKPKIIFSALKDKDTQMMIESLLSLSDDVTICEFAFYRAMSAEELAQGYPVKIEKDYRKAIDEAMQQDNIVLITGSLYFISLVREYIESLK